LFILGLEGPPLSRFLDKKTFAAKAKKV